MAEISRENIKRILTSNLKCLHGKYDCVGTPCSQCPHDVSEEDSMMALHKAISDMEKVELLEKENAELKEKIKKLESELSWSRDEYQMGRW